jgi:crotonobetainyl-CoA:carnitine CoA-transferase CaiB-like acyl-CoA transferase
MSLPLDGLTILDMSRALAGPYCAQLLADMGADVIKIEMPGKGDDSRHWGPPFIEGESAYFMSINRNKRSLSLDIGTTSGKQIFKDLVAKADVVIENMRPGSLERKGLSYKDLSEGNERLIWCSITGFGLTGPEAQRPGYDIIAQGMGGMMSITGEPDHPIRPGVALADVTTGMFASYGVMTALYERERSGKGQHVDTSLFEGQMAQMTYQAGRYFATGEAPGRFGNKHPLIAPYETIDALDGVMNVACGNDGLWNKFCDGLQLTEMKEDSRFKTNPERVANRADLISRIEKKTKTMTMKQVASALDSKGVPNGPVWDLKQVFTSEQAIARDMVVEVDHPKAGKLKTTGIPIKFSRTPGSVRKAAPMLGENSEEILKSLLNLSDEEINRLKEDKTI